MDYYGVVGNPLHHSLSPMIHRLFAEQTEQKLTYHAILVELDGLEKALADFQEKGGKGVNITLPFKHRAFGLVQAYSERAHRAEAINTIRFQEDGSRFGDNTDGVGLVRDLLHNQHVSLKDKTILILGAGGAVRGVIEPLLNEQPRELVVANRTEDKAVALVERFLECGPIRASSTQALADQTFDLIINGTSASLQGEMLDLPATLGGFCYDMVYGKGMTPFLQWAKSQGARYSDGLGMLVEQAALSFHLWRGVKPDTQSVFAELIKTKPEITHSFA